MAQDYWLSRADINKLVKPKYYQAHNELISMVIVPVMSLLKIVWISLPRVLILFKVSSLRDFEVLSRDMI